VRESRQNSHLLFKRDSIKRPRKEREKSKSAMTESMNLEPYWQIRIRPLILFKINWRRRRSTLRELKKMRKEAVRQQKAR
jgi:hypothetical protein